MPVDGIGHDGLQERGALRVAAGRVDRARQQEHRSIARLRRRDRQSPIDDRAGRLGRGGVGRRQGVRGEEPEVVSGVVRLRQHCSGFGMLERAGHRRGHELADRLNSEEPACQAAIALVKSVLDRHPVPPRRGVVRSGREQRLPERGAHLTSSRCWPPFEHVYRSVDGPLQDHRPGRGQPDSGLEHGRELLRQQPCRQRPSGRSIAGVDRGSGRVRDERPLPRLGEPRKPDEVGRHLRERGSGLQQRARRRRVELDGLGAREGFEHCLGEQRHLQPPRALIERDQLVRAQGGQWVRQVSAHET